MKNRWSNLRFAVLPGALAAACILAPAGGAFVTGGLAAPRPSQSSALVDELAPGGAQLINPEQLVNLLQLSSGKPLVLNIGPSLIFMQAHVPSAEFIGPASEPQAMDSLRRRVKALPRNTFIVLYCGCCPWNHCPNVRPAYKELHKAGFNNVKVLYIANNFGTDWVDKGYPTVRGQ